MPIWSNFVRNDIGKKLCHFFVFTLLTRVRPIKDKILNRFLRVADHDLFQVLDHTWLQKVEYLLNESLDLYEIRNLDL